MVVVPSAIIFVNNDLTNQVRDHLARQLHIDEILDGYVFDSRVASITDYPTTVKQQNKRILVIRSFDDLTNRKLADVAIFVKNGMAAIEKNNFGPPGASHLVVMLHWGQLCIFDTSF